MPMDDAAPSPIVPTEGTSVTTLSHTARLAAVLIAAVVLSGCSDSTEDLPSTSSGSDTPVFSGPWAAEFSSMYTAATTDLERDILADEVITEAEVNEMRSVFTACLTDLGYSNIQFADDGGFTLVPPTGYTTDAENDMVDSCSKSSGEQTVGALYGWISRNPENQDENAIMVQCLIRKGAVDPAYTAEEYEADGLAGVAGTDGPPIPYIVGEAKGNELLSQCDADPLGILE